MQIVIGFQTEKTRKRGDLWVMDSALNVISNRTQLGTCADDGPAPSFAVLLSWLTGDTMRVATPRGAA